MPIFEYVCQACDHEFEALLYGSDKPECPKCHGKRLSPQLSVFAVAGEGFLDIRKHVGILRFVRRPARPWRVLASRLRLRQLSHLSHLSTGISSNTCQETATRL